MKKGIFRYALMVLISSSFSNYLIASNDSNLEKINFFQKGEISYLEFSFDNENQDVKKFDVKKDKQIILDFKNVKSTERVMRSFDTSEFSGSIVFVSGYEKPGAKGDIRVNVQLRDNVRSVLERSGKRIILKVENRFGAFTQKDMTADELRDTKKSVVDESIATINVPKSNSISDILENLTLSGRKKYIGKKVSFDVRDMKVETILKMIADASGFNIILTEDVKSLPTLTLSLVNIPWDQALDTILNLNKLVGKKNGMILMITTLDKATAEKQKEIDIRKMLEKEETLVAKVFPISFAKITDLQPILSNYLTANRGTISTDSRTNSIIVKDTVTVVEKLKKIIEVLDTQTPQVLIESKVVEVEEKHVKEIGLTSFGEGSSGFTFGYDPVGTPGTSQGTIGLPGEAGDAGAPREAGPGFQFSSAPTEGLASLFSVNISHFNRFFNLNFALSLMEQEEKGRVISSPKVITQNKEKATISSTFTVGYPDEVTDEGKVSYGTADATLMLEVTPQVTNDGSISMEIVLRKEEFGDLAKPGPPDTNSRNINTNVLVDNGSTVVVGGVYSFKKSTSHSGVPFLKDIPLVGWLFRTPHSPRTIKKEMIIFITPRIINQEEAGLLSTQI